MRFGQFPAQLSGKTIILKIIKILDVANPNLKKTTIFID